MATTQNPLIGASSGSIGNATLSKLHRKNVLRSKLSRKKKNPSIKQQTQRNRYNAITDFFFLTKPLLKIGLKNSPKNLSLRNYFLKENVIPNTQITTAPIVSVNYSNIKLSKGLMLKTLITSSSGSTGSNIISVSWDNAFLPPNCSSSDIAYAVAFNATKNEFAFNNSDLRSDGTSNISLLSNIASTDVIHTYLFFISSNGVLISDSTYKLMGSGFDPDAQAFIDAVGTLNTTQQNAINNLVLGLKSNGTWSKYHAIYPFIGGTASSHKWNLKNPLNSDAAFRLTQNGTITHSSNGVTSDGSSGYFNTHFIPSFNSILNSASIGFYSRTIGTSGDFDFGCMQSTYNIRMLLSLDRNGNDTQADIWNYLTDGRVEYAHGSLITGLTLANRNSSSTISVYRNGVNKATTTGTSIGVLPNIPLYLLANNYNGSVFSPTVRQCAFATIADGFTDVEVLADYTVIQVYQTALGRNV